MMMIMKIVIIVDDKPEADGSTVVCVECAKEQFLHVASLPGHSHHECDDDDDCDCDDDDDSDCDCDDECDSCDDTCHKSA